MNLYRFILASLFLTVSVALLIQWIFPAPRWSLLCGGPVCDAAAQERIQQNERAYTARVATTTSAMFIILSAATLFFVFSKKRGLFRWSVTLLGAVVVYRFVRPYLFEYGNFPSLFFLISLYGILVALWLATQRRHPTTAGSSPAAR
ncbi:MAG: hypothetical protein HY340_02360 [Candidatus Kerfeldbacteria bacterium]|nr:hypothetical protein [Candidatus Kerfeldbacteria bacterium]